MYVQCPYQGILLLFICLRFKEDTLVSQKLSDIEKKVVEGLVTPFVGADNLLKDFFRKTQ